MEVYCVDECKVESATNDKLNKPLQAIWSLESIGIQSDDQTVLSKSEEKVLSQFKKRDPGWDCRDPRWDSWDPRWDSWDPRWDSWDPRWGS